jgi:hypothetical protein
MKIGLIDVDSHHFPNLALMKISAWHKAQGDQVEMFFPMSHYDKVYMSKVFDDSPDFETCINADEVIKGGTGYDLQNKLPTEIEHMYPDYSIYNIKKQAYGFLTRGCPRGCEFCIVGKKEGLKSYKVADLEEFWNGQREIIVNDPNLLACKDRKDLLQQLIDSKAWIDINQGLDIRFCDEEASHMINQLRLKMLHFAWDKMDQSKLIVKNLIEFKKRTEFDFRKLRVYVLTNFGTTHEEDLHRIYTLKKIGYDPYVMIYDKKKFVTDKNRLRPMSELLKLFTLEQIAHFKIVWKLQRWVNNKFIFRGGQAETFEDYLRGVKP